MCHDKEIATFAKENLECLAQLYKVVTDFGGFREAIAEQRWEEIVHKVNWPSTIIERKEIQDNPR